MSLLSKVEAQQITDAIAEVEKKTAGELVVVLTTRCDDYAFHRALWCTALTIGAGWGVYSAMPLLAAAYVFAGQVVVWGGCWLVSSWAPLIRLIVPRDLQQQNVEARCRQIFIEQGVTETRDRSGVLILLSETERQVRILADRGIHSRVTDAGWQQQVDGVIASIREGRTASGLRAAIEQIGQQLADAFPPRPDDENELSDEVVRL